MNKKRKFTRIALAGALFLGIAGTALVGCKDYDDDIDALRTDVDANKTAIAANKAAIESIQAQIQAGYILTDVKSDGNGGIIVTLSNGKTYEIKKGEKGEGVSIQGEKGEKGETPEFSIDNNGHLIAKWKDGSEPTDCGEVIKTPEITMTIDEKTGQLVYNGTPIGQVVGKDGVDGKVDPELFKIIDGVLYYGEKDLGNVVGAKGDTPELPDYHFIINDEGWLCYYIGEDQTKTTKIGEVTGKDGSSITANNIKFTFENGKLFLQIGEKPEEVEKQQLIDFTENLFSVVDDILYVAGKSTGINLNGNIWMRSTAETLVLNLPVYEGEKMTYQEIGLPTFNYVNALMTSVLYVPSSTDKQVHAYEIVFKKQDNQTTIHTYSNKTVDISFKVYPNVKYDKDLYEVSFDSPIELTKAAPSIEVVSVTPDWKVKVNIKDAATDKNYASSLVIKDLKNKRTIASDYFIINPATKEGQAVILDKNNKEVGEGITDNTLVIALDNANGIQILEEAKVYLKQGETSVAFSDLNLPDAKISYTLKNGGDNAYFTLDKETGLVKLAKAGTSAVDKKCVVTVSATFDGKVLYEKDVNIKIGTKSTQTSDMNYTMASLTLNGTETDVNGWDVNAVIDAMNVTTSEFEQSVIFTAENNSANYTLAYNSTTKKLTVKAAKDIAASKSAITLKGKFTAPGSSLTITVTINKTVYANYVFSVVENPKTVTPQLIGDKYVTKALLEEVVKFQKANNSDQDITCEFKEHEDGTEVGLDIDRAANTIKAKNTDAAVPLNGVTETLVATVYNDAAHTVLIESKEITVTFKSPVESIVPTDASVSDNRTTQEIDLRKQIQITDIFKNKLVQKDGTFKDATALDLSWNSSAPEETADKVNFEIYTDKACKTAYTGDNATISKKENKFVWKNLGDRLNKAEVLYVKVTFNSTVVVLDTVITVTVNPVAE